MHIRPQPDTKSEDIPFLDLNERRARKNSKSARKTHSNITGSVPEQTPFDFSISSENGSVFVDITPIPRFTLQSYRVTENSRQSQYVFSEEQLSTTITIHDQRSHLLEGPEGGLVFGLCSEILHDPAILDTCHHTFRLLCICDYMCDCNNGVLACPVCGAECGHFTINHRVGRTISLWLESHPEYKPTPAERQWRNSVLSLLLVGLENDSTDVVTRALESYSSGSFCIEGITCSCYIYSLFPV